MTTEFENLERKAAEEILAHHLLNFYNEFAQMNKKADWEKLTIKYDLWVTIAFLGPLIAGMALGIGSTVALGPGAAGIMGIGAIFSALFTAFVLHQREQAEIQFLEKIIIKKRLRVINPEETSGKMRELAKLLIEEQLANENKNLKKINLYKVASHAFAGLKLSHFDLSPGALVNLNSLKAPEGETYLDIQQAMLAGVKEKKSLIPGSPWFWIKCALMKLKQTIQLAIYHKGTVSAHPKEEQSDSILYFKPLDDEEHQEQTYEKEELEIATERSNSNPSSSLLGKNRSSMFVHSDKEVISNNHPTLGLGSN